MHNSKRLNWFILMFMCLVFKPVCAASSPIEVQIKGFDDGVKTSRQQDYEEALLFAKRSAIERAGVSVKSLTTAKDFQLQSDYIESQAEAVLLPGFSVMDIGYQEDGTYLVILSGKIVAPAEAVDETYDSPLFKAMQVLVEAPTKFTYNLGKLGYHDVKKAYFISDERFIIEHSYRDGQLILDEFQQKDMTASGRYRTDWDSGDVTLTFSLNGTAKGKWEALLGSGDILIERRQ